MKLEKTIKVRRMEPKRRYDDACGTAHGLELVGDRWALLVARELMLGPRRFTDLRRDLPGISANVLTERLEAMAAAGILTRRRLPPPAPAQVYELTAWGYELEPVIIALGRWAARSAGHDPSLPLSATSLMLSFRTMAVNSTKMTANISVLIADDSYIVAFESGVLTTSRGVSERPDATLTAPSAPPIAAYIYAGVPLEIAGIRAFGDADLVARLPHLFRLPPKASPPGPAAP